MPSQGRSADSRLVYSTDGGRACPGCGRPQAQCMCAAKSAAKSAAPASRDGIVRVGRETKGRNGKGVTVVTGLGLDAAGLAQLAKQLKTACGSGGTVKDGTIEVQGDHRDRVIAVLEKAGWKVKRAGG